MLKPPLAAGAPMPAGRALVLLSVLLLAAPLAAAEVPPKQRACTSLGCVQTDDQDGDGRADWANVALAAADALHANANLNRTNATHQESLTTEEHEALHVEEVGSLGADTWGYANLTSPRDGGLGFNDTELDLLVYFSDHDTGEYDVVHEGKVYLADADGDGWPERRHLRLLP